MKALKMRIIGWLFIFGIFFDMITTIIGCGILGTRELNPLGFTWYLMFELIGSMFFIWIIIKYYDRVESIKNDLSRPKIYKIFIILLIVGCSIRWLIVVNNLIQMYLSYNYTILFFIK